VLGSWSEKDAEDHPIDSCYIDIETNESVKEFTSGPIRKMQTEIPGASVEGWGVSKQ